MTPNERDAMVVRARAGEQEAFDALVGDLHLDVRGFVAARCPAWEVIEEVTQGAFVEAYRHLHRYEPRGTFAAWVKGFARHLLLRELGERARQRGRAPLGLDALLADQALADLSANAVEDDEDDDPSLIRLRRCLDRLPEQQRTLLQRRLVDRVPVEELARTVRRTRAGVACLLSRLRAALRACVERADGGDARGSASP